MCGVFGIYNHPEASNLSYLGIGRTKIGDDGLAALSGLTKLGVLIANDTRIPR